MEIIRTVADMKARAAAWKAEGLLHRRRSHHGVAARGA